MVHTSGHGPGVCPWGSGRVALSLPGYHTSWRQEKGHTAYLCHAGNKRRLMPCHKPLHSWQSVHKGCCHCWARQAPSDKHKGPYPRLEKRGTLMEAIADTVIPREYNLPTLTYSTKPFLITRILGKIVIMQFDHCPCLSERIGYDVLPETTIEEKDERVYAAWRLISHRIASSISCGGRS